MKRKIQKLLQKSKELPDRPGVYLFKNANRDVIYVGKALSLRKRVVSYFRGNVDSLKTRNLIENVSFFDYVLANSEAEALLYESQLIKKYQPKYNILLKDDKAYPMLKLTISELYPRLLITRKKKNDGALYFGPYTDAGLLKEALKILRRTYPLRSCAKLPKKTCLYYHLGQCLAPCRQDFNSKAYNQAVSDLAMFLEGNYKKLISQLKQKMKCFAEERLYEEAANIRDQIKALSKISQARENEVFKDAILDLKDKLQLEKVPSKIDAFDVSNIFGSYPVGAAVRFKDGLPDKSNYRRFKIKSVRGIDDFAMMKEIVSRRYKKASKGNLPDLIVIDGGRGQLNAAVNALRTLKINIMVISIAKEKEEIYFVDSPKTLILPPYDKSLKLIQRLRDEVHRFAISYHRNLRNRVTTASLLKDIKGIGVKRYKELKKYYPSIDTLKKTGLKELKRVPLIDEKTAKEIIKFLKKIN